MRAYKKGTKGIYSYCEPEEYQAIKFAALCKGVSISTYVKEAVLEKIESEAKKDEKNNWGYYDYVIKTYCQN